MNAIAAAASIRSQARELAEGLRTGSITVSDARLVNSIIREADGWLLAARRWLDPEASPETSESPTTITPQPSIFPTHSDGD